MMDALTLTYKSMAHFQAGRYAIECGSGPEYDWRWTEYPSGHDVKTLEDLQAMVAVGKAAIEWMWESHDHPTPPQEDESG